MLKLSFVLLILLIIYAIDCKKLRNIEETTTEHEFTPWETFYIDQYVDHFNFRDNRTFKQRYLVSDRWFDPTYGAVFFYPGNEADVELFWNNTGFIFDIAPIFQTLIVFAEHRYYGKTLPFGEDSFDLDKIAYLSIEQAVADYSILLNQLKKDYNLTDYSNPVIAFGGSYGGMLAAYMRFKYPNLVQGALASSAPIFILKPGLMDSTYFFEDVSNDFRNINGCEPVVRNGFDTMNDLFKKEDYKTLSDKFQLCKPISDPAGYRHLLLWLRNVFTVLSMANYPYKASFLSKFPAWPVNASCHQLMNDTSHGVDILTAFKNFAAVLYNDSTSSCFDIFAQFVENADPTSGSFLGNDAKAWDYQMCTELNAVFESNGVNDMFPELSYTDEMRKEYCKRTWGLNDVRADWAGIEFWGENLLSASNIVFSNGLLDPLHRGSPLEDVSESVVTVVIADGAHHLDLRSSNPADPPSVRYARYLEIGQIMGWINQARYNNFIILK